MLQKGNLIDGKYKILHEIGRGGMSTVYLAVNERANKLWAIKVLRRKMQGGDLVLTESMLRSEIHILRQLRHPNLPGIADVIETEGSLMIVMDYIEGNTLETLVKQQGPLPQWKVCELAIQLCDVLEYLHTRKQPIIYRDMKPSNIIYHQNGGASGVGKVFLVDFGTAREFKENQREDTQYIGTLGYAAPEQFGGTHQTDVRTDIYNLGATLYYLLTGSQPELFGKERMIQNLEGARISSGFQKIIGKCMEASPEQRYQNCLELLYDLKNYEKLEESYWRKQVFRLQFFLVFFVIGIFWWFFACVSYEASEDRRKVDYEQLLKQASEDQDYYDAILMEPSNPEAYLRMNQQLTSDLKLTKEEGLVLNQLFLGLEARADTQTVDVLSRLRKKDAEAYAKVCYEIGQSFLYYYDTDAVKDNIFYALPWFQETRDSYHLAEVYCAIGECYETIEQCQRTRVRQTDKLYESYQLLWERLHALQELAGAEVDTDTLLLIEERMLEIINTNLSYFMDCVLHSDMEELLQQIRITMNQIEERNIREEVNAIRDTIDQTDAKLQSKKEGGNIWEFMQ